MDRRQALLATCMALAAVVLAFWLVPGPRPDYTDPTVVESLFDSRLVIWIARLVLAGACFVLLTGGVFIVGSTVVRMRNGDWLRRVGPLEVSETTLAKVEQEVEFWRAAASRSADKIDELEARLKAVRRRIDAMRER